MALPDGIRIERWSPTAGDLSGDLDCLGGLLHACIHGGASVSFVLPFSLADATAFWRDQVLPAVNAGTRRVLLARSAGRIVGTAQLDFAVSAISTLVCTKASGYLLHSIGNTSGWRDRTPTVGRCYRFGGNHLPDA